MAYPHSKYEVMVVKDAALDSTGDKGDWAPGYVPHVIRAVAVVVTNTIGAAGVVKFDKRPTAGSDTSRGDGDIAEINLATTHDAGEVVYVDGLDEVINPGEEVVVEVTDACAASDTGHIIIYVEPYWEQPENNADMIESA
jgi:hypothetical protein